MSSTEASSSEKIIKSEKGSQLYCRYWNEDNKNENTTVKALLFIVHGYCEHCLYYSEMAENLTPHGYYVFSHDHLGHGQSGGTKAYIKDFDEYVQDIFSHVDQVKQKFPDKPVFLLGHSMGGSVAILSAMAKPDYFKGVILIGPLIIADRKNATPTKIFLGKIAAKVMPQMVVAKLDPKCTSRDEAFVKKYTEDPLVFHGGVKCGWGVAMLNALQKIEANLSSIKWPFIILHGSKDVLCELEGSQLMHDKAQSSDKQLKVFEDGFHQLHNEIPDVKKETHDTILEWMNERV